MKKIFSILAIAAAMVACSKDDATTDTATDVAPATYTLTGYSSLDTRTDFGTPSEDEDNKKIPFLWSEGDKILVLNDNDGSGTATEGDTATEGEISAGGAGTSSATFNLTTASVNGNKVYYNLNVKKVGVGMITAEAATTANVPAEQSTAKNLGQNGDFGYAEVADGAFTLNHATAYLWFDVKSLPAGCTLQSISFDAGEAKVAGEAMWDGSAFGEVNGSSVINLTVGNDATMVAMVVLPATIESATITYKLSNDTEITKTLSGRKEIVSGKTYKISVDLAEPEPEYELRVLTFEDGSEGWEPYECTFSCAYPPSEETKLVEKWSDYIPRDEGQQYGNGHGTYEWYDEGNTELSFVKPEIESWWGISGHAGISDYVGTDEDIAEFPDDNMLFMIDLQAYNVAGGANGSKNFCTHYGYLDPAQYATQYSPEGVLPGLQFKDGVPRVIDHMYVTNTTYAYAIIVRGECDFGVSYEYTNESTFKIVAYGYDSFEDKEPTSTEFYLLNTGKRMVTDWTKWDLSVLGEVVRVEFNLVACDNGYGKYGLGIPAYFAYDDVAVRFYDDEK